MLDVSVKFHLNLFCFHDRALEFIGVLLADVLTGQPDLSKCAKKAYESTLKKYHGWMVQGIFSVCFLSALHFIYKNYSFGDKFVIEYPQ